MPDHKIVSREEWVEARKALLDKEKELTRQRDALAAQVRELPWTPVEKEYRFSGPDGPLSLADLFDGRSQLLVYHFMFHPDWEEGCKSCSFLADHYNPSVIHLAQRDVSMVTVSRAPLEKLQAFQKRMGWTFPWVSSHGSDFNFDYGVSFTEEQMESGDTVYNYKRQPFSSLEAPGLSAFFRDADGTAYHTYSCYQRGLDRFITAYQLLDVAPKGRDEDGLRYTMEWLRHHDRYGGETVRIG